MPPKVTLRSFDGENFEVDIAVVADQSPTLKKKIEEAEEGTVISLPNINAEILSKVIEYCNMQVGIRRIPNDEHHRVTLYPEFIDVDMDTLYDLVDAARYLKIRTLKKVAMLALVDMIKGKTPGTFIREFGEQHHH